ncbi:hypothetical protein, partial [Rhodococcus maanshanensis]|uniref:hypothetical protein n=1 Tax=Rhodococcus maanshanensis TaxID=183556 RepID=UPI001C3F75E4
MVVLRICLSFSESVGPSDTTDSAGQRWKAVGSALNGTGNALVSRWQTRPHMLIGMLEPTAATPPPTSVYLQVLGPV